MNFRRTLRRWVRNTGFSRRIAPSFTEIMAHNRINVVLDVGANDGGYGREIRDSGYAGQIVSFEPNPSAFGRLKKAVADDPSWQALCLGVSDAPGRMQLNISRADVFSSFKVLNEFGAGSENAEVVDTVEVDVVRLDAYLKDRPELTDRAYLKIDTQGFEREVLVGLGDMISQVIAIQVETCLVNSYIGETDWIESLQWMRKNGFEVATMICNSTVPGRAQVREFDVVFVRSDA
jgi:FkbM family methyltransferase